MPLARRFSLALAISCLLHLLLLWLTGHFRIDLKTSERAHLPRSLHLSLSSTATRSIAPTDSSKVGEKKTAPSSSRSPDREPPPEEPSQDSSGIGASKPIAAQPTTVTATRIRETALEEARLRGKDTSREDGQPLPSPASKLQRRLNPPREPPGMRTMADGTLRVVTEFGTTFCVRPKEDWRILGPEDVMPMTVTCP
jgi:hypothetical protein